MKAFAAIVAVLLCSCAPTPQFADSTEENSVPLSMWVEYCEADGSDYRLHRAYDVHNDRTETRYWLNWHYDPNPKEGALTIPVAAWMRFRKALREIGCDKWHDTNIGDSKMLWRIYIEYPDAKIRAGALITPSSKRDFEPVRAALRELTDRKAF